MRWFIALIFCGLVARLYYLQIDQGAAFRQEAVLNRERRIPERPARGSIVDSEGDIIATTRPRFAVYVAPRIAKDPATLKRLATLLSSTSQDILDIIQETQHNQYDPLRIAPDVPLKTVTQIGEDQQDFPGVSTEPEPVRWYPDATLAAHLLGSMGRIDPKEYQDLRSDGYFSDDFIGKTGVERQYEQYLHGTPGGTDLQIDARGRELSVTGESQPVAGDTVVLAMNRRVQLAAERTLAEHHFIGATVAINPQTGAVIAMASSPSYDPNIFATGVSKANWQPLNTDSSKPMINRTLEAMYPPGSTFKPIVAAAGLQTGAISTHSTAYCPGYYMLGRARFGCWQRHGEVDFYSAMAKSCDTFFYIAGQKIGPNNIAIYAKDFGLQEKTGIDLPGEDLGTIPNPSWKYKHFKRFGSDFDQWFGGDTLHMAIGQGDVLVTPLQMARVTATLANGGDVLTPFVVDRVIDPLTNAVVFQNQRKLERHVAVSDQNMEEVRRAMRQTVTSGTGRSVDFPQVAVAAKTGSAQTHGSNLTHGWFICFAPYDHPTIAIAGVVEHGGHGASSAGLVAKAMLQAYFKLPQTRTGSSRSD